MQDPPLCPTVQPGRLPVSNDVLNGETAHAPVDLAERSPGVAGGVREPGRRRRTGPARRPSSGQGLPEPDGRAGREHPRRRGEAVGLLGPNGAGKTTVFYMIMGLVKPDKGTIELDGQT